MVNCNDRKGDMLALGKVIAYIQLIFCIAFRPLSTELSSLKFKVFSSLDDISWKNQDVQNWKRNGLKHIYCKKMPAYIPRVIFTMRQILYVGCFCFQPSLTKLTKSFVSYYVIPLQKS